MSITILCMNFPSYRNVAYIIICVFQYVIFILFFLLCCIFYMYIFLQYHELMLTFVDKCLPLSI